MGQKQHGKHSLRVEGLQTCQHGCNSVVSEATAVGRGWDNGLGGSVRKEVDALLDEGLLEQKVR